MNGKILCGIQNGTPGKECGYTDFKTNYRRKKWLIDGSKNRHLK